MSEKEEKWPAPGPGPYHSTTKRDGITVPIVQTIFECFLYALIPLVLIPVGAYAVNRWLMALPMDLMLYAGVALGLAVLLIKAPHTWLENRAEWMAIVRDAMVPRNDLNNNGIPDELEAVVAMLLMDSNQDGVSDFMDILMKYNGGESTLYVKMVDSTGNHVSQDELPYAERLPELARGYQKNHDLTYRVWTGSNGLFLPDEYAKLCAALVAQGYAARRNPNAPNSTIALTREGEALFARLVEDGDRIERELGRRPQTYTGHFQRAQSPTPAD
jgi:hypothetical protein